LQGAPLLPARGPRLRGPREGGSRRCGLSGAAGSLRVLIDNDLSSHIAAINALVEPCGQQVVALRRKFAASTEDVVWIEALGRESGGVVISGDASITRRAAERRAWRQAALVGFFLAPGWRKLDPLIQTARLLMWWGQIGRAGKLGRRRRDLSATHQR